MVEFGGLIEKRFLKVIQFHIVAAVWRNVETRKDYIAHVPHFTSQMSNRFFDGWGDAG